MGATVAKIQSKRIEEASLVDRIVTLIREAIVTGELEAGAHIGIKKLADAYGVSMIPVREVLARLLASRLVRVETNRGYFVASKPTPSEFRQFVQARELFETSVVSLGFENVTSDDIRKLISLNKKMAKIAKAGKSNAMVEWGELNAEFHQTLVGLARNEYLNYHYANLSFGNLHYQLVRSYPKAFTSLETLVEQHDEMIHALERRDKKQLLSILSGHIHNVTLDD